MEREERSKVGVKERSVKKSDLCGEDPLEVKGTARVNISQDRTKGGLGS